MSDRLDAMELLDECGDPDSLVCPYCSVEIQESDDWYIVSDEMGWPIVICGECYHSGRDLERPGEEERVRY